MKTECKLMSGAAVFAVGALSGSATMAWRPPAMNA